MADEFRPGMNPNHIFVDAVRQLVSGELREGAAEGRFAGNLADAFPTTKPAQRGSGVERFDQRGGGGELIDVLGDEGVSQPQSGAGWATFAAPRIGIGEASQLGQRDDFAELLVERGERPELLFERGEKLALEVVEDRRQIKHVGETLPTTCRSNPSWKN